MEENIGKRINVDRVDEALSTNPKKIATGCPFCRVMLNDGVTARQEQGKGEGVEVVDVAQLMLNSVTRLESSQLTENIKVIPREKAPVAAAPVVEEAPPAAEAAAPAAAAETPTAAAEAPEAAAPAAKPKGLGLAGGAKAPGGKGLQMKGAAKAPGAKAAAAPATEAPEAAAPAAPAAKPKGLGLASGAKAPGKGLQMKGGAKAPGAKAAEAPAAPAPAAEAPATPAAEAPKAPPVAKAGGLGFKSDAKAPGRKK
jgi:hypothetical protein